MSALASVVGEQKGTMFVIGEFREKEHLIAAIQAVRSGGSPDTHMDIFSEEPIELRKGVLDRPSKMSLVSVVSGGLAGIALTSFIYWAQHDYKLITGGMPTYSWWATGVISFEMTMLGAVLCTFLWFLWESGLIRKRDKTAPVPLVPPGAMCLRVRCESGQETRVSNAMRYSGAFSVQQKERA